MSGLQRSQSIVIDLDIRPLAGRIGAQIDNVQLEGDFRYLTLRRGGRPCSLQPTPSCIIWVHDCFT